MAKKLWVRAGITLHLTDDDAQKLLVEYENDMQGRADIVKRAVKEGRFELDGECYTPAEAIGDYNNKYGTDLPEEDHDHYW